ncbi:MAG TPA: putative 2OG-Fe(II) oxygenase [Rhizomicrobium sp.]|nr:putative 2OG-Fe(II) oxygenase [Rhizomicrobium sp.]
MTANTQFQSDAQVEQLLAAAEKQPNATEIIGNLADAYWRAGDHARYAALVRRAFLLKPHSNTIAQLTLEVSGELDQVRERLRALIAHGVAYAPVIAALAIVEARRGDGAEVRHLMNYERYFRHGMLPPPAGMTTADFNRALADEIKASLTFYDTPSKRSIRRGWRHDGLRRTETPALRTFMEQVRQMGMDYIAQLDSHDPHPFAKSRPSDFAIDGWAVVSGGETHHLPHTHSRAWGTGVYYVVQPEVSREPGSHKGWLRVGPPPEAGATAGENWEQRLIEPVPGSFIFMPGYFHHDTEPMGVDQERICVAFEIQPKELTQKGDHNDY